MPLTTFAPSGHPGPLALAIKEIPRLPRAMTGEVKQKIPVPVTVLTVSSTPLIPADSHLSINTFCTNALYDTRFPVCEQC